MRQNWFLQRVNQGQRNFLSESVATLTFRHPELGHANATLPDRNIDWQENRN